MSFAQLIPPISIPSNFRVIDRNRGFVDVFPASVIFHIKTLNQLGKRVKKYTLFGFFLKKLKILPDSLLLCRGVINNVPIELITMIGGGITGFIFRYMAERAKEKSRLWEMALGKKKAEDTSADKAAKRVPVDIGKWVRRLIVICVLFGVILAPFILTLLGYSTIVEVEETDPTWFFGLFGGGTEITFVELPAYLMVNEVRQTLTAIIGFYFGNATAACKT